jgi:pimeloyl-ACP methyl ester carboxylesterase
MSAVDETEVVTYPGARRPDRVRTVSSSGIELAVYEWGEPDAPPILMAHGGFDFAGTFDGLAARLADGGHRCVAWDARGHGDSQRAVLYSWGGDVRDALAVLNSIGGEPVPFLGHSKGGGILLELADACPHRVSRLINLDGLPSNNKWPDVSDRERIRMAQTEIAGWLDHRRVASRGQRKPDTLDGLARRRARMNPRLDLDWLRYVVTIGARHDPDGWRWKIDPTLRPGGFGPWRPEWSMQRVPSIGVPFLGVLGLEPEVMGWGTQPDDVTPYLPPGGRFVALEGVGHFVHIEQPDVIAELVLDFLS